MPSPDVSLFAPSPSTEDNGHDATTGTRVDVLILTALEDELGAVLALAESWEEQKDLAGFPYHRRTFTRSGKRPLVIAAAWLGKMGRVDAAIRGGALLRELGPACVAMCGICAGKRGEVALGDVIIADRLYSYDEGKNVAEPGKEPVFHHDIKTYDLHPLWSVRAAKLARETDLLQALQKQRPPSKERQRRWLLHMLYAQHDEGAPAPTNAEQEAACPDWTLVLDEAEHERLVTLDAGVLSLTTDGRNLVRNERIRFRNKLPDDPDLRVHVGTVGTGSAVQKDPRLFDRLRVVQRSTIGVEMEGAAIGELARHFDKHGLVVKAVSDHGDMTKDDSFRKFACHASAKVLLTFLLNHVEPTARAPERREAKPPADEHPEVHPRDGHRDRTIARVERVARLREPGATITRREAPAPFAGLLEIEVQEGALVDLRLLSAVDQPVTQALVTQYLTEVELPYRRENPMLASTLIHGGEQAPLDLARAARQRGVTLKTFAEYQGLIDFTRYLEWQTRRLEADTVYPPWLYVDPPATWSFAGMREENPTENALATLRELLDADHGRFALVLGDFGAGKTFLLHELARRFATEKHPLVPVLVEMSRLEKQQDLKVLLAQHFARADMGRFDPNAFMYMLAEGRIALLFDGFDELALRLTYPRALEHFETIIAAAQGNAKVVVTSRTQHFLTDKEVRLEMAKRAEQAQGYRLLKLARFGERQIKTFLQNFLADPKEAEARYALLHDVKDLLGLSENPRMLGFIAKLEPEKLLEARANSGEITAAKLYEILIGQWLDYEYVRTNPPGAPKGISRLALRTLVSGLACVFWERNAKTLALSDFGDLLTAEDVDPSVVEHMVASGSLLVRDTEGRFSFVHRSVMEWLVAKDVAWEVREEGDARGLGVDEMSPLMAEFFIALAGRETAERWALARVGPKGYGAAKKNAAVVLKRLAPRDQDSRAEGVSGVDLEGQDLQGKDFSGVTWVGANLARADLRSATLRGIDLRGASLVGAKLTRADLEGAMLAGADLTEADLGFARLMGADLRHARGLTAARLRGAKLVGAQGVDVEGLSPIVAAPQARREVLPMMMVKASRCYTVAWNKAGDLLASGHDDGSVRLWDGGTGQPIRVLQGHASRVRSVVFSPDGLTLASGSDDRTVRLWDVASASFLCSYEGHKNTVTSVVFSPDGLTLASGSDDRTVWLWDVASASFLCSYEGHKNTVTSVAFSPDGLTLASGSRDRTLRLWDVASARFLRAYRGHKNTVTSVTFSPDGLALASGSYDRTVRLWDVASARFLRAYEEHMAGVTSIAFSPDGLTLASGSYDNTLRLWDVASARFLRAYEGHTNWVMSVAFSPDGLTLVSGSDDRTVRFWDVASARLLRAYDGHTNWVRSVAFSPDGLTLASGSSDKTVRLWNVDSARSLRAYEGHTGPVRSVAFSPDGLILASGSDDNTVRLWDVDSARSLRAYEGHRFTVTSVAFSPDGLILASGSDDNTVRLWDVASARFLRACEGHTNPVRSVAFSPDGLTLASGSEDKTVRLWDVTSTRCLRAHDGHTNWVRSVAFSHDGLTLASGSDDKTVRLWDIATARFLCVYVGHMNPVMSVAFSPDGLTLASGSDDKTVRLWDVTSMRCLRTCEGHTNPVMSVAFSPDGLTLASASSDGTLRLWHVATGRCLAVLFPRPEGWAAFTPDGRYKVGGDIAGAFWHVVGLCRFEPGELDPYLPDFRVPDGDPLFTLPAAEPTEG